MITFMSMMLFFSRGILQVIDESQCVPLFMNEKTAKEERKGDRDERMVWMFQPHPLNYISSKIVVGDSDCHGQRAPLTQCILLFLYIF